MRIPSFAVCIAALYAGLQMLSDVASLKIGLVGGFAVDMGTFIYPFTFTLRDLAHKTLGKKNVRALVVVSDGLDQAGGLAVHEGLHARNILAPQWHGDGCALRKVLQAYANRQGDRPAQSRSGDIRRHGAKSDADSKALGNVVERNG